MGSVGHGDSSWNERAQQPGPNLLNWHLMTKAFTAALSPIFVYKASNVYYHQEEENTKL